MTEQQRPDFRPPAVSMPTAQIQLPPKLLEDLKKIAPQRRRSRVPYVIGIAFAAVVAWALLTPSVRTWVRRKVSQRTETPAQVLTTEPTASTPAEVASAPPITSVVVTPVVRTSAPEPSASAVATAPPPKPKPKKPKPKKPHP